MLISPIQSTPQSAHAELRLEAPLGEVFAYVTDLQNMVTWWPEHTTYRRLFGDGGPGSTYAMIYQAQMTTPFPLRPRAVPGAAPMTVPIAAMSIVQTRDHDARFVYWVGTLGLRVRFEYDFRADGGGTLIRFAMRSFLMPPPIPAAEMTRAFERLGTILAPKSAAA